MSAARALHTATLLANGTVLVTGGISSSNSILTGAELYDPASNSWSPAAPLNAARVVHTATLLGNGAVLVTGGDNGSGALPSCELYTSQSGAPSITTQPTSQTIPVGQLVSFLAAAAGAPTPTVQ